MHQKGFLPIWIVIAMATVLISGGIVAIGVQTHRQVQDEIARNRAASPPLPRGR